MCHKSRFSYKGKPIQWNWVKNHLFTSEQADILKTKTDYNGWLRIVQEKNKLPMDKLNSPQELTEIDSIIS